MVTAYRQIKSNKPIIFGNLSTLKCKLNNWTNVHYVNQKIWHTLLKIHSRLDRSRCATVFKLIMNMITAIKQQQKNKSRVSIFIDDEYAFSLTKFTAAWLKTGQELTEEKISDLKSKDENEVLLQKAINFISYRPRSIRETRYRLRKYGSEKDQ